MPTRILFWLMLVIGIVLTVTGCLGMESRPLRDFAVQELLIDLSVLPDGWYVSYPPQPYPENRGQDDSAFIQFDAKSPMLYIAQHSILMYESRSAAAADYQRLTKEEFSEALLVKPWHVPTELNYKSPIADQFRLACADRRVVAIRTICIAIAQYDEYISIFNTLIVPDFMTYTDAEQILKHIDNHMARYLNKRMPTPIKSP